MPRGSLGPALHADYRPILCNRLARERWGPAGVAIPDQLSGEPGSWRAVDLPADLAAHVGQSSVDLADPSTRQHVLPIWLETGPADLPAATHSPNSEPNGPTSPSPTCSARSGQPATPVSATTPEGQPTLRQGQDRAARPLLRWRERFAGGALAR